MKAFINTIMTKEELVKELKWHRKQDSFIQGTYGDPECSVFRGCAVGCSLESLNRKKDLGLRAFNNHELYETHLNIPKWYAKVQDAIFEGLPAIKAADWAVESIKAIPVGANINEILSPFLVFILEDALTTFDHTENSAVKKVVDRVAELHKNGGTCEEFREAANAAAAANAAWAASGVTRVARVAAYIAEYAAEYAATAADYTAEYAATATIRDAAEYAVWAATAEAGVTVEGETFSFFSAKVIELLEGLEK